MSTGKEIGVERRRGLARGAAAAMLLAGAACQQNANAPSGQGGMFDGGSDRARTAEPNASAAVNQQAEPPVAVPTPAPVEANTTAPVVPTPTPTPAPTPTPTPTQPAAPDPGRGPGAQPGANNPPRQEDRRVRIVNRSGQVIREVRGSPATERGYGPDRIPRGMLPDGGAVVIDFDDRNGECLYDLLVVFRDGSRRDQGGVDVCRISQWTILPTGSAMR